MSKKKFTEKEQKIINDGRIMKADHFRVKYFDKFNTKTFGEDLAKEMYANKLLTDEGVDILADKRLDLRITNLIRKSVKDVKEKKAAVIKERVKDIVGIDIDFEEENKRRFKRFAIERTGNKETVYFNNGTPTGISIVTFVYNELPVEIKDNEIKINTEITYY